MYTLFPACMYVYMCTCDARRGLKKSLDPLEPELQLWATMCMLGTKLSKSSKWSSTLSPSKFIFKKKILQISNKYICKKCLTKTAVRFHLPQVRNNHPCKDAERRLSYTLLLSKCTNASTVTANICQKIWGKTTVWSRYPTPEYTQDGI